MENEHAIEIVSPAETQTIMRPPNEKALAIERAPDLVLKEAQKAAQALKGVIDKKLKKVVFNGKTYLEYEDWQTVARFYCVTARVKSTSYVEYGGAKGFEATAEALLVSTDQVISQADAMCLNDEENWGTRKKYKWIKGPGGKAEKVVESEAPVPLFQLKSMAQTRACAKALRNVMAWVVVLAGYAPTPAEEMSQLIEVQNTHGSVEAQQEVLQAKLEKIEKQQKKAASPISEAQARRLWAIAKQSGWSDQEVKIVLKSRYKVEHTADIPRDKYEEICKTLEGGTGSQGTEGPYR